MQQAKAANAASPGASAQSTTSGESDAASSAGKKSGGQSKASQGQSKQSAAASTQTASAKKTTGKPGRPPGRAQTGKQGGEQKQDAVALLKNDHRTVEQLFKSYEEAQATSAKTELARQICMELIIHTHLEEEVFYPACRENGVEDDIMDEAQVEHDGAKVMIADLLEGSPEDHYYDAKVKVLKEYIRHHVNEEEKSDGIFAKARQASLDLEELGTQLKSLKEELTAEGDAVAEAPLEAPSLQLNNINTLAEDTEMARQSGYDDEDDYRSSRGRGGNNRMRDNDGRFMNDEEDRGGRGRSRSSRSNDDEEDDRGGRSRGNRGGRGHGGWFGDSEGHSEAAREGWRSRDNDDDGDDRGGRGRSRSSRSNDDDDDRQSSRGRSQGRERDEEGRFMSDDDRGGRGRSSRSNDDDDEDDRSSRGGRGRGHGGWFGDSEGHSRAASQRQQSQSSGYDDEDDRGGRQSRGSQGRGGQGSRGGQGGRGQGSRGRGGEGHGGWFGDSEGHSEASRRGWRNRD